LTKIIDDLLIHILPSVMNSTTTRVHPEEILEPELVMDCGVEGTDSGGNEGPTVFADVSV